MIGNSDSEYSKRIKTISNDGEFLFEKYCKEKNHKFNRIGFDENEQNVDNYWRLNKLLRNLPDYIVNTQNKTFVVSVKGTDNFKEKEFKIIDAMCMFFNTTSAPWIYAFCFKEESSPIWMYPDKVKELYEQSEDQQWHDGVVYRNLNIRKKKQ